MQRLNRMLTAVALMGATAGVSPAGAQSGKPAEIQTVRASRGSIVGLVADERGTPLPGALVSALGAMPAMTVSDDRGRFSIESLPAGEYVLQAHLAGFAGSARELVRIGGSTPSSHTLQLRRLERPVATSGSTVMARPIMAAGFGLPAARLSDQPEEETPADGLSKSDHPHTETAWRLRHIRRSILKNTSPVVALVEHDPEMPSGSFFGRAMDSAATIATTLFTDLPFSGEVNLLTTGALEPGELFGGEHLPRGVAYLAIGAPTPAGDWSVRAAMSQGDLAAWIVAGAFTSRSRAVHNYQLGFSYSKQEYLGGNPAALAAVSDGSRNVGEAYAFDRWIVSPKFEIEYGGRYARHDYLEQGGLLSPRLALTVRPIRNTRVTATVAQRMVAPGAEEFLANDAPGPWLPPERTFAPLGSTFFDSGSFRVERARYLDVLLEHQFEDAYVLGVRRFYQDVNDQLVTLFGLDLPEGPQSVGHYYVDSAGAVDANGWALRLSSPPSKRMRGSIDYSVTRARWIDRGNVEDIAHFAPAAVRREREDLHDVTTSFETDIPETATRVFVLYKINTGYTRDNTELVRPGLDARFELQVNQALPIAFAGTQWEILVGVRNLFRDATEPGSVYDELLVVRPPKRVVGGFLVKF